MADEKKIICPHSQKECIKDGKIVIADGKPEIHTCPAWVQVHGSDPQTGEPKSEWNCSQFHWMPFLMIENSAQQRSTASAVESFRNEMVKANESSQQILIAAAGGNPALLISEG